MQDRYEVLANQYAKSGIKGLTDMIMPAKDLSRCGDNCAASGSTAALGCSQDHWQ